jgi:hypothetical protein
MHKHIIVSLFALATLLPVASSATEQAPREPVRTSSAATEIANPSSLRFAEPSSHDYWLCAGENRCCQQDNICLMDLCCNKDNVGQRCCVE